MSPKTPLLRIALFALLCIAERDREAVGFADLMKFVLGDTGVPYVWEYGDQAGKS